MKVSPTDLEWAQEVLCDKADNEDDLESKESLLRVIAWLGKATQRMRTHD